MRKKVAMLLAQGFEEAEAVVIIDVLRRLDIEVEILACQDDLALKGYWGIQLSADALLSDRKSRTYDALVLPGGPAGARNLGRSADVIEIVKAHQAADRWICTICSAGAHVLAANKLLQGRRYVCSGDNFKLYADGCYVDEPIVEDGKILICKGLGLAFEFAFAVGAKLIGADVAQAQAEHIYFDHLIMDHAVQ